MCFIVKNVPSVPKFFNIVHREGLLTGVCDRETVGGLQVVHIVIEVEGFLRRILVGVIQLDSKPEGAVLLHCRAHEQSTYTKEKSRISTF